MKKMEIVPYQFKKLAPALLLLHALSWASPVPDKNVWTVGKEKIEGRYEALIDGSVHLRCAEDDGSIRDFPFEDFSKADQRFIVDAENTALPANSPDWMEGYAVRYILRVMDDPLDHDRPQTVLASIPTGGWLKPDVSDLRVVTLSGKVLPVSILAHDPMGDTLLQFTRNGMDRWYWVYAVNPDAPPQVPPELRRRIERTRKSASEASLKVMELRRESAEIAGELRGAQRQLSREQTTIEKVSKELEKLAPLIKERQAEAREAEAAVAPLEDVVSKSESRLESAENNVQRTIERRLEPARRLLEEAEAAAESAEAAYPEAVRRASAAPDEMERMRMINEAKAVMFAARRTAETRSKQLAEVEEDLVPLRMAVAGAQTELEAAQNELAEAQRRAERLKNALEKLLEQRADAEKLKADSEAIVKEISPRIEPMTKAAEAASQAVSETAELAKKLEAEFQELSFATDPLAYQEGLSMEVRDWGGDQLDELSEWSVVVEGLKRSDNVLGGAPVTDVLQKMNPFRLGDTLNFAASYRGFLKIEQSGLYRFFLNADDASFLFLNEYLVFSRVGSNRPIHGRVHVFEIGEDIELDAGIYRLEIHQVTGNTPGAEGRCAFYWILPGENSWSRVPPESFVSCLSAMTAGVEAFDGQPVAVARGGIANTMNVGGMKLHLARFKAAGAGANQSAQWDFGDGLRGTGNVVEHVYFGDGDYEVGLASHPAMPPFKLRFHAWEAPIPTNPLALEDVVRVMDGYDLDRLDAAKLGSAFAFLSICGQPARWPLLERVSRRLLREKELDRQYRVDLYTSLMEAIARQGRSSEAIELAEEALDAAGELRSLVIEVQFKLAEIYRRHLRDFDEAGRRYAGIVEDNRRFSLDSVRRAAIAWGDMFVDMGDTSRAAEIYRMAGGLGMQEGPLGAAADAATRGALLRVAEQQLRDGDIRHAGRLLDRIEMEYPEQKVEGLYRFLRAEADRNAGRYLSAIRHYEVVMRLRQWAGYRAPAMFGIADSYYRMEDFDNALRWIDSVRDTFPTFFEQRELSAFREVIAARRAAADEESAPVSQGVDVQFSPDTQVPPKMSYRFLPVLGMTSDGLVLTGTTDRSSQFYEIELQNVVSEGAYWVEFWYQNEFVHSHARVNPMVNLEFFGDEGSSGSGDSVWVIRTFGQYFLAGAILRAPVAQHGRIRLTFDSFQGVQKIHGLRVRPISAFQEEALQNFMEGVDTPSDGVLE